MCAYIRVLPQPRPLIIPFQGHRYCQRGPATDWIKATGPLWSGFEHGLPVPLPHVELSGVDPYRIVNDAVGNRVGDGVSAESAVPFPSRHLRGEHGAGVVVPEFHELEEEAFEWFVGFVDEPFVDGEQVVGGVFAHELGNAARLARRDHDLFGEVGHARVYRAVSSPARGFRQRA